MYIMSWLCIFLIVLILVEMTLQCPNPTSFAKNKLKRDENFKDTALNGYDVVRLIV